MNPNRLIEVQNDCKKTMQLYENNQRNRQISDEQMLNIAMCSIQRIDNIISGYPYYDYENQTWITTD